MREELFEKREQVGENIFLLLKDIGFTKSSFAMSLNITRPTLNRILSGEIVNLAGYKKYIENIMRTHNVTEDQLLNYVPKRRINNEPIWVQSFNAPESHEMSDLTKEKFLILDDILNICEIYLGK